MGCEGGSEQKYLKGACLKDPEAPADGDICIDSHQGCHWRAGRQEGEGMGRELGAERGN